MWHKKRKSRVGGGRAGKIAQNDNDGVSDTARSNEMKPLSASK